MTSFFNVTCKALYSVFAYCLLVLSYHVNAQTGYYGASKGGGLKDLGTIFKTDSNGNNPSIVYSFPRSNNSSNPEACGLTVINNQVYGVSYTGGKYDRGTIYRINPVSGKIETLYEFPLSMNYPVGNLVRANNGMYYGIAQGGGTNNTGYLYSFDTLANTVGAVFNFPTVDDSPAGIIHKNGKLYFFSPYGSNAGGCVASYDLSSNTYSVNYSFDPATGLKYPTGYIYYDGVSKLSGTCQDDPTYRGGMFSYDIVSNTFTQDTVFVYTKGYFSNGGVVKAANGLYYGTTQRGGSNVSNNNGTIFSVNPVTHTLKQEFQFSPANGTMAGGNLILLPSGEFVGYTETGGTNNSGVIYKFDPATAQYTKLYDFSPAYGKPTGQMLLSGSRVYAGYTTNGLLYNGSGGTIGGIFSFDLTTGQFASYPFMDEQGIIPAGGIIHYNSKVLGLTSAGGKYNNGTVYTYDLNTNLRKDIFNFPLQPGGSRDVSFARLVKAPNGKAYGTAIVGGSAGSYGHIYEVDPVLDTVIVKYIFSNNYYEPLPEMTMASDGNFYGICKANGAVLGGSLSTAKYAFYKYDISTNAVTILQHSNGGSNGENFNGGMIEIGNTKEFIGTSSSAGYTYINCAYFPPNGGPGIVFKFNANTNVFSVLYDNRCQSQPYSYPDQVTNMIYLSPDSIFMANCADVDYTLPAGGRFGKIVHLKTSANFYSERKDIKSFNNYLSFSSSPLRAANKKFYLSSFNISTSTAGNSMYNNGSFFEYNPYTNAIVKKFDFNTYNIYSAFGGLIEYNPSLCTPPPAPVNSTPGGNRMLCAQQSTTLTVAGSGIVKWYATPSGTVSLATGNTYLTSQFPSPGTYTFYAEANTCTVSAVRTPITVTVNPTPTLTVNSGSICPGQTFTMTPSGALTYTYSSGSATVSPLVNSSYTITGANVQGCTSLATSSVSINPTPTITVNSGSICPGQVFTMTPSGALTYTYSSGSATVSPTTNSSYTVSGTNSNGCTGTAISSVTVNPVPSITVNSGTICSNQTFTMVPSGANTYTYSSGSNTVSPVANSSYTVTGTDVNGCVNSVGAISTVSVNATPSLTVTPNSTVCVGTSTVLNASGATTYAWSNGAVTASISVSSTVNVTYTVMGTDLNTCSSTQTVAVTVNQSCQDVWPGDANSDGTADNFDVLELGLHFTQTGSARATTSNTWQSYFANNWTGTISNGKNVNHSDCNGDGMINNNDTLAIFNNYGLTHTFKQAEQVVTNPQLSIVPDQNAVAKGSWGTSSVFLGEASAPVTNINGLAFTITFDQSLIDANSFYIEYPTSFINAANQNLDFSKPDFTNGKLYTATTHTITNNISGNGKIAILHYKIKSTLTTDEVLNIGITQTKQSNAAGVLTPLTAGTATVAAIVASVGMNELSSGNSISIYPNPANSSVTIQSSTSLEKLELMTVTGQLILSERVYGTQHQMNVSDLANGVYFVVVHEAHQKVTRKKLVVQR
jgi:uncharacterized repeat protein (TIGR03803 family)